MTKPAPKTNLRRHHARCCAVQALYQWQHTQQLAIEIIQQFAEEGLLKEVDRDYFTRAVEMTIAEQTAIDEHLTKHADRGIKKLNPVELSVLRVAVYEFIHCPHVPYRVILNEALEITKEFGAVQGYKYVNALLDRLSRELRPDEQTKIHKV